MPDVISKERRYPTMTILLETPHPITEHLSLHIHTDVQIKISANQAQYDITQYVHSKISSHMHAKPPILVLGPRVAWRVPIHLTFPSFGDAGQVGTIDVDVETGQAKITDAIIQEIESHAEDIARRFIFASTR